MIHMIHAIIHDIKPSEEAYDGQPHRETPASLRGTVVALDKLLDMVQAIGLTDQILDVCQPASCKALLVPHYGGKWKNTRDTREVPEISNTE